MVQTTGIRV